MALQEWMEQSRCANDKLIQETFGKPTATDVFFDYNPHNEEEVERLRRYCDACPVEAQCLDFAMRMDQRHGFWGGQTEEERYKATDFSHRKKKPGVSRYMKTAPPTLRGAAKP